jgi:hypothetical protein
VNVAEVRKQLRGYLADWQTLLRRRVGQAQQMLRRLIVGQLEMTPHKRGRYYTFAGTGTVRPLLAGVVQMMASPPGFEPGF